MTTKTKVKVITKTNKESKSKSKQLKIDLNKQLNPCEEIHEAYKGTGDFFAPYTDRPEYNNEKRIFLYSKANHNAPIKHKMVSLYRTRQGTRGWIWGFEHLSSFDYYQNPIDHTRTIGKADVPQISKHFSMNPYLEHDPNAPKEMGPSETAPEIVSVETKYFWEFDKMKDQLRKWYEDGLIDDNTNLYVVAEGNRKYNVDSFEEFLQYDIQDLILVNKSGISATPGLFSPKEILQMARKQARSDLQKLLKEGNNSKQGRSLSTGAGPGAGPQFPE